MTLTGSPQSDSDASSRTSLFDCPTPTSDISVREIIDKYYTTHPDLLKHALMAKIEEDKKLTANDILRTEQARIELRRLDIELLREQSRLKDRSMTQQKQTIARIRHHEPIPDHPFTYQQQLTKSFAPPSPIVVYPHSAHPLCTDNRLARQLLSTGHHEANRKRGRGSISEEKPNHNKVMEALKAKIQRSGASTSNSAFRPLDKKQRTLPKPTEIPHIITHPHTLPTTPSPRSAKPILPPIDTSIGRLKANNRILSPIQTASVVVVRPSAFEPIISIAPIQTKD
ncbi:hypothetical protein A0J61_08853 [Choanephora cucurbitarum]|uniref:Uncharacterized protein n=1 Tax=Choanephora cucurbitarum TaxID=101091 RepID=A0A1C7N1W9_9FUNG|nr:hypothetical protein A0J61_08853 [Choanephora cucurbitarum]